MSVEATDFEGGRPKDFDAVAALEALDEERRG